MFSKKLKLWLISPPGKVCGPPFEKVPLHQQALDVTYIKLKIRQNHCIQSNKRPIGHIAHLSSIQAFRSEKFESHN